MKKLLTLMALLLIVSCTDAQKASLSAYGEPHKITLYSGGVPVRQWVSTGKVQTITESDGWQFKCSKTRQLIRVGGNVVIEVK